MLEHSLVRACIPVLNDLGPFDDIRYYNIYPFAFLDDSPCPGKRYLFVSTL